MKPIPTAPTSPLQTAEMSALGHKRKWCHARVMSVLPLKADIRQREWHVRFVPIANTLTGTQPDQLCHLGILDRWGPMPS
jgi:hypothetical protein